MITKVHCDKECQGALLTVTISDINNKSSIKPHAEQAWSPLPGWPAWEGLEKVGAHVSRSQIQRVQVALRTASEALATASLGLSRRRPPVRDKQNQHDCLVERDRISSRCLSSLLFVWNALWALKRQCDKAKTTGAWGYASGLRRHRLGPNWTCLETILRHKYMHLPVCVHPE